MNVLTQSEGLALMAAFGLTMLLFVWRLTRAETSLDGFLLADRRIGIWQGAFSLAVSWIWAPAIFICSLQAYENGLAGIFWFTLPNVLCFVVFAPFALKLRRSLPRGYTWPECIAHRFESQVPVHLIFLVVAFAYQLGAIVINAVAGGALLHALCGIEIEWAIVGMALIALSYSLLGGLKASVLTDVVQMSMILFIAAVIVPLCVFGRGEEITLAQTLGGVRGSGANPFDGALAFTLGIPMTLGLLAGPFCDQMFTQRAFALEEKKVIPTFILAGAIFAIVPALLSLLGFFGAGMVQAGELVVSDSQLVGPLVIAELLPKGAVMAFCVMAFAGLCSTMDSAYCAASSLAAIDLFKRYRDPAVTPARLLDVSRVAMLLLGILGTAIALLQPKLMWVFLIYGAFASAAMFPLILALISKKISAEGAFLGVSLALLFGTPLSFYANISGDENLIVLAAILSAGIGLITGLLSGISADVGERQSTESVNSLKCEAGQI